MRGFCWWFVCAVLCLCRDSGDCLVLVLSLLHWLSIGVPGWLAMDSKRREGVRGSLLRSVRSKDGGLDL